ncbi:MAG: CmpA/NrtA family ABC transporter substrate-binding protein [Pseudomonadota bacterium]
MADSTIPVSAGFLPLLDSALLVVAAESGFAAQEDIELSLVRETNWASIRDRMAVGHFDVAHMLAPMPVAARLGLTSLAAPMIAPMALGLGGNAITVSQRLWEQMRDAGAPGDLDPGRAGQALKVVVDARARAAAPRLRFAVVHPHSGHNFELRYWLAAVDIAPDTDVEIHVVSPPLMADALDRGQIDGFCVGEPWNTVAVDRSGGHVATVKSLIWRSSPEKVLAAAESWADAHPQVLDGLLRALHRAALWCEQPEHHEELADLLAAPRYLDMPSALILPAIRGRLRTGDGGTRLVEDFFLPATRAATFPWQSHALWFYSQMVRWGQIEHSDANARGAMQSYRPDLYRAALAPTGVPVPGANAKVEGALAQAQPVGAVNGPLELGPDGFFDGRVFDPADVEGYLARNQGEPE